MQMGGALLSFNPSKSLCRHFEKFSAVHTNVDTVDLVASVKSVFVFAYFILPTLTSLYCRWNHIALTLKHDQSLTRSSSFNYLLGKSNAHTGNYASCLASFKVNCG